MDKPKPPILKEILRPLEIVQSLEGMKEVRLYRKIIEPTKEMSTDGRKKKLATVNKAVYFDGLPDTATEYIEEYFQRAKETMYLYYYNAKQHWRVFTLY